MVVANPKHRQRAEEIWKLPAKTLNPKVGSHITKMMRDLEDGSLQVALGAGDQPVPVDRQRQPLDRRRRARWTTSSSSRTSTRRLSCKVADLILPSAMIFEKWGAYGNSERRTQMWRQQVPPPGEARSDVWQMMEFSKRFTLDEVWGEQTVPGLQAEGFEDGKLPDVLAAAQPSWATRPTTTLYDVLFATPAARAVAWPDPVADGRDNRTVAARRHRLVPGEGAVRGVRRVRPRPRPRSGRLRHATTATTCAACAGRWSTARRPRWRFNEEYDPYAAEGRGLRLLRPGAEGAPGRRPRRRHRRRGRASLAGKAKIFFRPYAAPAESPGRGLRPVAVHRPRARALALRAR